MRACWFEEVDGKSQCGIGTSVFKDSYKFCGSCTDDGCNSGRRTKLTISFVFLSVFIGIWI